MVVSIVLETMETMDWWNGGTEWNELDIGAGGQWCRLTGSRRLPAGLQRTSKVVAWLLRNRLSRNRSLRVLKPMMRKNETRNEARNEDGTRRLCSFARLLDRDCNRLSETLTVWWWSHPLRHSISWSNSWSSIDNYQQSDTGRGSTFGSTSLAVSSASFSALTGFFLFSACIFNALITTACEDGKLHLNLSIIGMRFFEICFETLLLLIEFFLPPIFAQFSILK